MMPECQECPKLRTEIAALKDRLLAVEEGKDVLEHKIRDLRADFNAREAQQLREKAQRLDEKAKRHKAATAANTLRDWCGDLLNDVLYHLCSGDLEAFALLKRVCKPRGKWHLEELDNANADARRAVPAAVWTSLSALKTDFGADTLMRLSERYRQLCSGHHTRGAFATTDLCREATAQAGVDPEMTEKLLGLSRRVGRAARK